jgi:hypothetical protein
LPDGITLEDSFDIDPNGSIVAVGRKQAEDVGNFYFLRHR